MSGRYPENWKEIVATVNARAENRCERCGVPNGALGYRTLDRTRTFVPLPEANKGDLWQHIIVPGVGRVKLIKIILTTAHLGLDHPAEPGMPGVVLRGRTGWHKGNKHDKADSCAAALAALCQACHLREDHADHLATQARKRDERRAKQRRLVGQLSFLP